jgi:predicted cobalt transporter CbtA
MTSVIRLLHVFSAFWFVSGLVARAVVLNKAEKSTDIKTTKEFVNLAGVFERLMVIPGSLVVFLIGVGLVLVGDYRFMGPGYNWVLASIVIYFLILALVPTVFLPKGKRFDGLLAEASSRDQVTPQLTAALRDPAVRLAHWVEFGGVLVVIALMVTKPF